MRPTLCAVAEHRLYAHPTPHRPGVRSAFKLATSISHIFPGPLLSSFHILHLRQTINPSSPTFCARGLSDITYMPRGPSSNTTATTAVARNAPGPTPRMRALSPPASRRQSLYAMSEGTTIQLHWLFRSNIPRRRSMALPNDVRKRNFFGFGEIIGVLANVSPALSPTPHTTPPCGSLGVPPLPLLRASGPLGHCVCCIASTLADSLSLSVSLACVCASQCPLADAASPPKRSAR